MSMNPDGKYSKADPRISACCLLAYITALGEFKHENSIYMPQDLHETPGQWSHLLYKPTKLSQDEFWNPEHIQFQKRNKQTKKTPTHSIQPYTKWNVWKPTDTWQHPGAAGRDTSQGEPG